MNVNTTALLVVQMGQFVTGQTKGSQRIASAVLANAYDRAAFGTFGDAVQAYVDTAGDARSPAYKEIVRQWQSLLEREQVFAPVLSAVNGLVRPRTKNDVGEFIAALKQAGSLGHRLSESIVRSSNDGPNGASVKMSYIWNALHVGQLTREASAAQGAVL